MKVELTYFKDNGKYYTSGDYETRLPDLYKIWDEIVALRNSKGPMPGLIGTWDGPISVDVPEHPHNHPHLIMPKPFLP